MPRAVYQNHKHPDELIVDALVEEFDKDVDLLVNFMTVNGRPAFMRRLTEDEMLLRFANPETRREIIMELQATGGNQAVFRYLGQMTNLMRKIVYGPEYL